jgi:hypothetical protein
MKSVLSDRKETLISTFVLPIPSNSISTSSERSADERVDEREKLTRAIKMVTDRSAKRVLACFHLGLLTLSAYIHLSV